MKTLASLLLVLLLSSFAHAQYVYAQIDFNKNAAHQDYQPWMDDKWIDCYMTVITPNGIYGPYLGSGKIGDESFFVTGYADLDPTRVYTIKIQVPNQVLIGSPITIGGCPTGAGLFAGTNLQPTMSIGALWYNGDPF